MKMTTKYVRNMGTVGAGSIGLRPGQPMAPEPCEGVISDEFIDIAEKLSNVPDDPDCLSDEVPCGTVSGATATVGTVGSFNDRTSKAASRTLKIPDLITMWKYLLSRSYADRKLVLYSYLNRLLRRGRLSEIVGFTVQTPVINREILELKQPNFWKIDHENFYADIEIELNLQSHTGLRTWLGIISCWCSFENDAFSMSVEDLISEKEYNGGAGRKEAGLVKLDKYLLPIYTNQQMDELMENIWIQYGMPEALRDPSVRNATELAGRLGLTVVYLDVYEHRNMDSIIFFEDSALCVGEDRIERDGDEERHIKTGAPETVRIPANTIVVNTNRIRRDYSAFNIFHEITHYLLHYLFFRLQQMCSNDVRLYKVKEVEASSDEGMRTTDAAGNNTHSAGENTRSEDGTLRDPVFFMEKQADRGAYGLIMPAGDTRTRIDAECGKVNEYKNKGELFEKVGKALSMSLRLPHFRVKPRMVQLGYIEAKGALNYVDRKLIRPFAFDRDSWSSSEVTFVVKESTTYGLYKNNADFKKLVDKGGYVYADGHMIRKDPRLVRLDGDRYVLTDRAAKRVNDCCLRFRRQYVQSNVGEYTLGRMYFDPNYVERTLFYLRDTINQNQLDEIDAKMDYKENFPKTFKKAFDQIMRQNGETRECVAYRLHMSDNTLRDWLNNPEEKIRLDFIVTITLMWEIPEWLSKMLVDCAMIKINEYDRRHQALEYCRTVLWDQGVEKANEFLKSKGQPLLTVYEEDYTPRKTG